MMSQEPAFTSGCFPTTKWTVLLNVIQRGDAKAASAALESFCTQYRPAIRNFFLRRRVNPDEAEEYTQNFFLQRIQNNKARMRMRMRMRRKNLRRLRRLCRIVVQRAQRKGRKGNFSGKPELSNQGTKTQRPGDPNVWAESPRQASQGQRPGFGAVSVNQALNGGMALT